MNYELTKWYDRLWAALIFFTRLPFWRIYQPPKEANQGVVEFWPLAGWLTAGVMAGVLYGTSMVFNYEIAIEGRPSVPSLCSPGRGR